MEENHVYLYVGDLVEKEVLQFFYKFTRNYNMAINQKIVIDHKVKWSTYYFREFL